jgi:hypothetical protein
LQYLRQWSAEWLDTTKDEFCKDVEEIFQGILVTYDTTEEFARETKENH